MSTSTFCKFFDEGRFEVFGIVVEASSNGITVTGTVYNSFGEEKELSESEVPKEYKESAIMAASEEWYRSSPYNNGKRDAPYGYNPHACECGSCGAPQEYVGNSGGAYSCDWCGTY